MSSLKVYSQSGEIIGEVQPSDRFYREEINVPVLHQVVVAYLANRRRGTASTKTRSEVRGSGRKLYPQKHTGRARAGDAKSPIRIGGGVAFGPRPRSYRQFTPKKMRRLALLHAIADKFQNDNVIVVDRIEIERPRTKAVVQMLDALGLSGKVLIVLDSHDRNVYLSARNIPGVNTCRWNDLNAYDVLWHDKLLMTKGALENLEAKFVSISKEVAAS
jgi:large subunit ribosomal protein L4